MEIKNTKLRFLKADFCKNVISNEIQAKLGVDLSMDGEDVCLDYDIDVLDKNNGSEVLGTIRVIYDLTIDGIDFNANELLATAVNETMSKVDRIIHSMVDEAIGHIVEKRYENPELFNQNLN